MHSTLRVAGIQAVRQVHRQTVGWVPDLCHVEPVVQYVSQPWVWCRVFPQHDHLIDI